jgi:hypothetical protein
MSQWRVSGQSRKFVCPDPVSCVTSLLTGFLLNLFLLPWRWRRYVPPKCWLTLNGLHAVISQKMVLLITTAVRTSKSYCSLLFDVCVEVLPKDMMLSFEMSSFVFWMTLVLNMRKGWCFHSKLIVFVPLGSSLQILGQHFQDMIIWVITFIVLKIWKFY